MVERRAPEPIVPLGLFRNPTVSFLLIISPDQAAPSARFGQLCGAVPADHDGPHALARRPAVHCAHRRYRPGVADGRTADLEDGRYKIFSLISTPAA